MSPSLKVPNLHPQPQYITVPFLKLAGVVLCFTPAPHQLAGDLRHARSTVLEQAAVGGEAELATSVALATLK